VTDLIKNKNKHMKYIVDINERTTKGKALKMLLANEEVVKIKAYKLPELIEEDILIAEMQKSDSNELLTYEQGKNEFAKIKKRLQE
jgi:hypothetical protein